MSISLNYEQVRLFAKSIRVRIGRDVKHKAILSYIAHAAGDSQDAMMHRLKTTPTATLLLDDAVLSRLAASLGDIDKNKLNDFTLAGLSLMVTDQVLIVDKPTWPFTYFTFEAVEGKTRLSIHHPEDNFQDYGFAVINIMDAELVINELMLHTDQLDVAKTTSIDLDFKIDAPFTLKLENVDLEKNRYKMSDTHTLDRLIHEIGRLFLNKEQRYITTGSGFRHENLRRAPGTRSVLPTFSDHKALARRGTEEKQSPAPWFYTQIFANSLQSLQLANPADWRNETNTRERVIRILKDCPPPGPIRAYADKLYTLHRATQTLIDAYEKLSFPILDSRMDELQPIKQLIEEIILKEKRDARTGNEEKRKDLASLAARSIGMMRTLPAILKDHDLPIAFDHSHWVDAFREIISNPGWDNFDDVAAYIPKNPMMAYNGYRQDNWTPD